MTNFFKDFLTALLKTTHLILLMNLNLILKILNLGNLPHPHQVPAQPPTILLTHQKHFLLATLNHFLVTFLIEYLTHLITVLILTTFSCYSNSLLALIALILAYPALMIFLTALLIIFLYFLKIFFTFLKIAFLVFFDTFFLFKNFLIKNLIL